MEKAEPTHGTQGRQSAAKPDTGVVQSQIDQLLQMQAVLQDTLRTQLSLIHTHLYLVNATAADGSALPPALPLPVALAPHFAGPHLPPHGTGLPAPCLQAPHSMTVPQFVPLGLPPPALQTLATFQANPQAEQPGALSVMPSLALPCAVRRDSTASSDSQSSDATRGPASPVSPVSPRASTEAPVLLVHGSSSPPAVREHVPVKRISTPRTARFPTPVHCSPAPQSQTAPSQTAPSQTSPLEHTCPHCSRAYSLQRSLIQHLKIHMDKCPYQCSDCGRRFSRKGHLVAHIRTHTDERPYACGLCHKSFNQKSGLVRHTRSHNQGQMRRFRPVPAPR